MIRVLAARVRTPRSTNSAESFQAFFEEAGAEIGALMAEAGVTNEPQPTFWRPLDTPDRF